MSRSITSLVLAATMTTGLAGCAGIGGEPTQSPTSGTNRPSESEEPAEPSTATVTVTETPTAAAEPEPEPVEEPAPSLTDTEGPGILKLGKSFTYSDGLQVTVSTGKPFTASDTAAPTGGAAGVLYTITMVNGTGAAFDPSLSSATMQAGNTEAEEIFDSAQGLDGSPTTTVLPGREVEYQIGFEAAGERDVVLEFTPSFDHGSLLFTPTGR